jgi:hypothetical protein
MMMLIYVLPELLPNDIFWGACIDKLQEQNPEPNWKYQIVII